MVTISREIRIPAAASTVWWVLATPTQQPLIDDRVHLVTEWGQPGTVGSGYELAMRGRPPMRLTVTDAEPGARHITTIEWNGRARGSQEAHLRADGTACVLAYAMSVEVPRILRPLQRIYGRKQLDQWLESVARVSATTSGPHS
ncbi:hypothetical protein ABIE44_000796 [Marmoricola sp. OAE513]|uniref:SRPBCC family protein n=1 Tax=Marmoricola sp. OAE513 TaxID=2817894 RepID=UPI001AEA6D4C